jgi:peptidylprolyl isomerase
MRFALILALSLFSACKKDDAATKPTTSTEAPKVDPAAKPADPPPRSAKLPDIKKRPVNTTGVPTKELDNDGLPFDINPPNVPRLTGKLVEDRGVQYIDEKVGTGPAPVKGKPVKVHYTGWLTDGSKFDSSVESGKPIEYPFDGGMVIKGWDIAISSMKAGGKRRILLPANVAYGDEGAGDAIPPGAVLVFDVELVEAAQ